MKSNTWDSQDSYVSYSPDPSSLNWGHELSSKHPLFQPDRGIKRHDSDYKKKIISVTTRHNVHHWTTLESIKDRKIPIVICWKAVTELGAICSSGKLWVILHKASFFSFHPVIMCGALMVGVDGSSMVHMWTRSQAALTYQQGKLVEACVCRVWKTAPRPLPFDWEPYHGCIHRLSVPILLPQSLSSYIFFNL